MKKVYVKNIEKQKSQNSSKNYVKSYLKKIHKTVYTNEKPYTNTRKTHFKNLPKPRRSQKHRKHPKKKHRKSDPTNASDVHANRARPSNVDKPHPLPRGEPRARLGARGARGGGEERRLRKARVHVAVKKARERPRGRDSAFGVHALPGRFLSGVGCLRLAAFMATRRASRPATKHKAGARRAFGRGRAWPGSAQALRHWTRSGGHLWPTYASALPHLGPCDVAAGVCVSFSVRCGCAGFGLLWSVFGGVGFWVMVSEGGFGKLTVFVRVAGLVSWSRLMDERGAEFRGF